jgi:polyphosphate kinase 2
MAKFTANGTPKLDLPTYERELKRLQAELVTMQQWVIETGSRVVVLFEGRDAAGKGSAIKRMTEYLNPRHARIAALPAPTERDKTSWYFQRYIAHLPAAGEIVLFDRSWYNRAGVEHVMGFCTDVQYARYLRQCPSFERMLIDDGIMLRKYWFSVSDVEQEARFRSRASDPMRRWKLSPMDMQSITRWEDYSRAKDTMMQFTDLADSPWYTVESEDKKRSRLNVIAHLLSTIPYEQVMPTAVEIPHRPEAVGYNRPPRESNRYVPDITADLAKAEPKAKAGKARHKDKDRDKVKKTKGGDKGKAAEANLSGAAAAQAAAAQAAAAHDAATHAAAARPASAQVGPVQATTKAATKTAAPRPGAAKAAAAHHPPVTGDKPA